MNKLSFILVIIVFLLAINIEIVKATTTISSCSTTISSPGDYNLTDNITGTATCLTIASSNVNLDCNGYSINFGTDGAATRYGVDIVNGTNPLENVTVKNCVIQKTVAGGASGIGIRMQRTSNSQIYNNTLLTNGTSTNYGIYALTSCNNNLIDSNIIDARGSTTGNIAIYVSSDSNYNTIRYNNVSGLGTTTSYGLYLYSDSNYNNVYNNNFTSTAITTGNTDMHTIYVSTSKYNNITNNNILSIGNARNYAIYVYTLARYNNFINNTIINNGTGATNYGIYSLDSNLNTYENNNLIVQATTTLNGVLFSRSNFNTVRNNSITVYSTSTPAYAVQVANSYSNVLDRNNYYVNGTGANNVIYLTNGDDNEVTNSFINITGNGNTNYGIYNIYSNRNKIENNTIYTRGASTNPSIVLSTCKNNLINNNEIHSYGTTTLNYGVYLTLAEVNNITNNNISTAGTTTNYGVYLLTNANDNLIQNNTIIPTGTTTLYGTFLSASSRNNIYNNYIVSNGSTQSGTTNNWAVYLTTNSNENEIINNSIKTGGGTPNYGVYLLTDSDRNVVKGNNISAGGTGATNLGVYISASNNNNIENNIISTSGTATDYGVYVYSSSLFNTITNNTISTLGSTTSYGIYLAVNGVNFPIYNNFTSNSFSTGSSTEFRVGTAAIDNLWLIDQPLDTYLFTGIGSLINVKNSTAGEIRFTNRLTGSGSGFSNSIRISENYAYVDSTISALNKSAEVTIYNRSTTQTNLGIYVDGLPCPSNLCTSITSLQAGNVTFNVSGWSYYSINASDQIPQVITLLNPTNNTNISGTSYDFNFTVTDETSSTFNCNLYLGNSSYGSNSSVQNNTQTIITASGIPGGTSTWYISCLDQSNLGVSSEIRAIQNSAPAISYNNPSNGSYINNQNYILLNSTISDTEASSFTVYTYGDGILINTSNNINNGEFTYNWTSLSLGPHNWSMITYDGSTNSSEQIYNFNLVNLSILCEAGGPYQENALILIQGNTTDGTNPLNSGYVNLQFLNNTQLINSSNRTIDSNGKYTSSLQDLTQGNYTLNATLYYQGLTKNCLDNITVSTSQISSTPSSASLVLDKIISLSEINSTNIVYNITLRSTNKGGSNSTSTLLTDSDSDSSPYSLNTLSPGDSNLASYLKSFERNSTNYNVTLSQATLNGTDYLTSNSISAQSSETILVVPATTISEQLTLVKNAYFNSENSTTMNYTISIEIINSGGLDLSSITLIDSDLNLNTVISLNRSQEYNYTSTILVDKAASNTNKLFVKSTATYSSITYESNQIQIRIPGYGGPADAIAYSPEYVDASTSFDSNITVINQNPDIGQDFIIDYWITSNDELTNYTSGQQTIYVSALGNTTLTATLTSPSTNGTYRFRTIVSWVGGTATAYDSFFINSSAPEENNSEEQDNSGSSGSSAGIPSSSEITGSATSEIICNPPYIRYGPECCLDSNNNAICDNDETIEQSNQNIELNQISKIPEKNNLEKIIRDLLSYYYVLIIITLIVIILILIKKNKKERQVNKLTEIPGIKVYTSGGKKIGLVKEAYLEKDKLKIYGWLIKLDKQVYKKLHKKFIIIRHVDVNSIKHVMLINEAISEQLDKLSNQEKFINPKTKN